MSTDHSRELQETVTQAYATQTPLQLAGHGSKAFYGPPARGEPLDVTKHCGIIDYEPSELVITARAGTPLSEIEAVLSVQGQMLGFEPPYYGQDATLGGAIACGFSGPCRPYTGAARDFVLGIQCLNGKGDLLHFGGRVMKNVAGYDVSRLMVGALGSLGVLLEVSLKVLPKPAYETTLVMEKSPSDALTAMNTWAGRPLPVTAAAYGDGQVHVRLSGPESGVKAAAQAMGGDADPAGDAFWQAVREQQHGFFQGDNPLWRLSLAPATPPLDLPGQWFWDWGGAQRWLKTEAPAARIRAAVSEAGGHATLFRRPPPDTAVFHPLPPVLRALQQRIKLAFDPARILNYRQLY